MNVVAQKTVCIALVGNPNCGKTTILNQLANAHEAVGNYPRVTVTPREYRLVHRGRAIRLVDLPGIYSMSSKSPEERAGRDFIHLEKPDVVVNILDAGNLDRSLFLTTQLIEMDVPRVHVLNMADEARKKGISINLPELVSMLGGPVVEAVATTGEGLTEVLDLALALADGETEHRVAVGYDSHLEQAIATVEAIVANLHPAEMTARQCRWLAIKLLEGDEEMLTREGEHAELIAQVNVERETFYRRHGERCEHAMAGGRYGFIRGLLMEVRTVAATEAGGLELDDLFLHRFAGLPILMGLMWLMFEATFQFGGIPADWIKSGVDLLTGTLREVLPQSMVRDLVLDGVLAGVGGTIVFLPNVVILFFFLALFSETGYIARAAFLLDRVMHVFGLHGKALIPLVMGYGCNVPAIMATRTIESERSRIITALVTPFMCCSARLPLLMLFAGAFFTSQAGTVVFVMYVLSIATALGSSVLLSKTLLRSKSEPFVMELPPYRMPTLRAVLYHMWENATGFLQKVGSVILVGSIVIWFLQAFPRDIQYSQDYAASRGQAEAIADESERTATLDRLRMAESGEKLERSYLGRVGIAVSPLFAPLGFGWKDTVAILTGIVAKEAVVASYAVLYAESKESAGLQRAIAASMPPLQAFAFMVFVLLYLPCLSTIGALRREAGSWRWAGLSVIYSLGLAWGLALLIVRVGGLLI
ncbi:MAG TPA: ferrous iron transport protein B [Rhodospirillaceae bacterium]|nr:ferrous iron transport protein B [Rhodospirillaceae bacterium]